MLKDRKIVFVNFIVLLASIAIVSLPMGIAKADDPPGSPPTKSFIYKKTKQGDLEIIVHYPPGWKETDKRPSIVFFFGGGWTNGRITQFEPQDKARWDIGGYSG